MRSKIARLAGVVAVFAALSAIPAGSALAASQAVVITVQGTAYLQPDGSALVTVSYSCLPGYGTGTAGGITGSLEQTQGFGTGAQAATCDDHTHTTTLDMAPGPFTPGPASANITLGNGVNEVGNAQVEVTVK